ncbi:glycosyltransferase [Ensifer sp. ENS07]|uniref:glycosyltransferase n=1 Tax=Ensifer sp. ENS07 TaxID=2769274 RepID=UPI00177DF63D|nr:glycosyltransferase [Ensifer sp. ENS07]MBD9641913.1 glycosyltransferase [Ensifer sp. ENS07]
MRSAEQGYILAKRPIIKAEFVMNNVSSRNSEKMAPHLATTFSANSTVTVIIPIRITEGRRDLIERLKFFRKDHLLPDSVDFLVVDDGSADEDHLLLRQAECDRLKVIRTGARYYQDFSLARARNHAAQRAVGDFIVFMDADLLPYPGFYRDILFELHSHKMQTHVNRFLMVPVIYLTDRGHLLLHDTPSEQWRSVFINAMNADDRVLIEKHSTGTSVIVVDRRYYLSRGGQDEDFQGWGFEDYEFANRLIRRLRMFALPPNWLSMAGNFMTIRAYDGWKATYRLYGDWLAAKGIYLFHAPHPVEHHYHSRKDQNLKHLLMKMKADQTAPNEPPALPDLGQGTSLLFRKNPFCWDREFAPYLGTPIFMNENEFASAVTFLDFVRDSKLSRVVFANPYANEKLLALYKACKNNNIPIVVCERGALPGSIYHDRGGFLSDSNSYSPEYWDIPLTSTEREMTLRYISEIRYGDEMLEQQAGRADISEIKGRLGITRGQKVLLVPFQQPNDTVIRHFSGQVGSYENFRRIISELVERLGPGWRVVYKKHPAETDFVPIGGASAAHEENIYDLIEISSAVAVINSGVGIYAMMFGKPLLVFGESWYSHDGLCHTISPEENLVELLNKDIEIDYERVLRFIHYLRFKFYSFGNMTARRVRTPEGSPITATSGITYFEVRNWSEAARILRPYDPIISRGSPLFDRYRNGAGEQNNESVSGVSIASASSVASPKVEGRRAFHIREFQRAAELFEDWMKSEPNSPQALRSAAEAYYNMGDFNNAHRCAAAALRLLPNNKNLRRRVKYFSSGRIVRKFLLSKPFPIESA